MTYAKYLVFAAIYPFAHLKYASLAALTFLRSLFSSPRVLLEAEYAGEKIILLALYEKGELRPDVVRLLSRAKEAGFYVLAVNSGKLIRADDYFHLIDCYIERFNHGRDFGSYKTGFLHIFSRQWEAQCPRLLMLNDSVFFVDEHVPKFLDVMGSSEFNVLGATENHEIDHHLGSFCVSMSKDILMHPSFKRYWERFSPSDLRPRNIKLGEVGLSKTLRKLSGSDKEVVAHFDAEFARKKMRESTGLIEFAYLSQSSSPYWPQPQVTLPDLFQRIKAGQSHHPKQSLLKKLWDSSPLGSHSVRQTNNSELSIDSISTLQGKLEEIGISLTESELAEFAASMFMSAYVRRSQVHAMAPLMLRLGCPLIKLDLVYRGVMDHFDLKWLLETLESVSYTHLRAHET